MNRPQLPVPGAAELEDPKVYERAVVNCNKFSRLSEEQRRRFLSNYAALNAAFGKIETKDIPEREKSLAKKKKSLEDILDDPKNATFMEFFEYLDTLKRNADDGLIKASIEAMQSDNYVVLSDADHTIEEMQQNLTLLGASLTGHDSLSLQLFVKLYKQFFFWAKTSEVAHFESNASIEITRQVMDKVCLQTTRFTMGYMKKMSVVIQLVREYPRLMWSGAQRDMLYKYVPIFSLYMERHPSDKVFWTTLPTSEYLASCQIFGQLPRDIDVNVMDNLLDELSLNELVDIDEKMAWFWGGTLPAKAKKRNQPPAQAQQAQASSGSVSEASTSIKKTLKEMRVSSTKTVAKEAELLDEDIEKFAEDEDSSSEHDMAPLY